MGILRTRMASLRFQAWLTALAAIVFLGFYVIIAGFIKGHELTFNTSTGVPWGILISTYLFFVLPASGLCLISSLGHIFGMKGLKSISKRAVFVAIVLMLAGFLVIASELERPWLMALFLLLTPNPSSAMWWMGTLYGLYLMTLIIEFFFLCRVEVMHRLQITPNSVPLLYRFLAAGAMRPTEDALQRSKKIARLFGIVSIILAIAALSTLGAVFGLIAARTLWSGAFTPVYFVSSALLAGDAVLILIIVLTYRASSKEIPQKMKEVVIKLGRLLGLFLAIFTLFTIWNLLTAQYGRMSWEFESVMVLINGPLRVPFWVGEILLGLVVPASILVYTRAQKVWGVTVASLSIIISTFVARYDLVVAGQLVPVIGRQTLWQYIPSMTEILTVIGALALFLLLYSLGNRFLPLDDSSVTLKTKQILPS